jgi:hypothetical protein
MDLLHHILIHRVDHLFTKGAFAVYHNLQLSIIKSAWFIEVSKFYTDIRCACLHNV